LRGDFGQRNWDMMSAKPDDKNIQFLDCQGGGKRRESENAIASGKPKYRDHHRSKSVKRKSAWA
jgi:hypothetical protein